MSFLSFFTQGIFTQINPLFIITLFAWVPFALYTWRKNSAEPRGKQIRNIALFGLIPLILFVWEITRTVSWDSFFAPLNGYTLLNWLVAFIFSAFGAFIFFGGKKEAGRWFAAIMWTVAAWAFTVGCYYLSATPIVSEFWVRLSHLLIAEAGVIFFLYSNVNGNLPLKKGQVAAIVISQLSIAYLTFFTDLLTINAVFTGPQIADRTWIRGPWTYLADVNFLFFFIAGILINIRDIRLGTNPEQKRRRFFILTSSIIGLLPGILVMFLLVERGGGVSPYWFTSTAILGWVGFTAYAISRTQFLSVRFIFGEVLAMLLLLILFFNIFISAPPSFFIPQLFIAGLNPYSLTNWVIALTLLLFSVRTYQQGTTEESRRYLIILACAGLWAALTGFVYFAGTDAQLNLAVRASSFVGNLMAVSFFVYTILGSSDPSSRKKIWGVVTAIELALFYAYFWTDSIVSKTTLASGSVLNRTWELGSLNVVARANFFVFLGLGFWYLYKNHIEKKDQHSRITTKIFFTSLLGMIPIIVVTALSYAGYTQTYWLGPLAAISWIATSFYAITKHEFSLYKVIFAELGIFALIFLFFGNVFSPIDITSGVLSKIFIFVTFTGVGFFFIRNIIKSEEQKDELSRLSVTLSDLNKNLKAKVIDRTREVEESKTHIETVLENLTNGLLEYNAHGALVRINKAAEKMLNIRRENLLGRTIGVGDVRTEALEALTLVSYPELSEKNSASAAIEESVLPMDVKEVIVHHPEEKEFQVTVAPIHTETGDEGTVRVIRDVTRENLISRSKSEFISIAAHQLRSPLALVRWTFSAFLSGDFGPLSEPLKNAIVQGEEANNHMVNLVNDLLVVARIEGGKLTTTFAPVDLRELVQHHFETYKMQAEQKSIIYTLQIPETKKAIVSCDADQIGIAIDNILSNAILYTPNGGTVTVSLVGGRDAIRITIKDSGVGIPTTQKDRLFSKFYRAERALRMNPNGSGLGLFIVRNIMSYHKGSVSVTSVENKGTTATLSFPRT
jgi:signal transduction histidine kinase